MFLGRVYNSMRNGTHPLMFIGRVYNRMRKGTYPLKSIGTVHNSMRNWTYPLMFIGTLYNTFPFEPYIRPRQAPHFRVRADLGVMAMKVYSKFPKSAEFQIQFSVISGHSLGVEFLTLCRNAVGVFNSRRQLSYIKENHLMIGIKIENLKKERKNEKVKIKIQLLEFC